MDRSTAPDGALRRRLRQQEVVADLSRRALDSEDVDELLSAAVSAVADCLDTDACGVFERRNDGGSVLLRAGVGWPEGTVGEATASAPPASTVGRVLDAGEPVAFEEATAVDVPVARAAGAASTLGAPISLDGDRWGVLEVRTATPRSFADCDRAFLADVADVLGSTLSHHHAEAELEEVYGRISDAFFALDRDWCFTYLNERAHELINPEGEQLVGANIWDAFPAALSRKFKAEYEHAMYEQESVTFEEYYPEPLDAWFEVSAYPSETGLSVYFQDVTERVTMKQDLRQSEARFRMLAEELDEVIWMATADASEFVYVNPVFEEIWGMSPERLYAEPMAFIDAIHPEDRERVRTAFEALPAEPYDEEFRIVRPDGEIRWIHARGTQAAAEDVDGEMVRVIGIGEDITEHKRRQARLEELVDELEASNERLEQFAYAASHDLQEPLRMVSSYLQLIDQRYADDLDADGREFIEYAVDGADRMREMIQGLLEYSRVETGGTHLERVELSEVLDAVEQDLRMRIDETDADIAAEPLPTVAGDEHQLRQVFQNLLENAIEYSGDAAPSIRISATRTDEGRWAITVSDEGIGIDPEAADRVFEVFERLHAIGDHPGTGIGLALCERIVEGHGGEIWVDSEAGSGAAFTFTLPPATEAN